MENATPNVRPFLPHRSINGNCDGSRFHPRAFARSRMICLLELVLGIDYPRLGVVRRVAVRILDWVVAELILSYPLSLDNWEPIVIGRNE